MENRLRIGFSLIKAKSELISCLKFARLAPLLRCSASPSPHIALAGIGCCIWVTVRDKGGHFLYLNLGLCLLLITVGAVMRSACLQVYATLVLEMNA